MINDSKTKMNKNKIKEKKRFMVVFLVLAHVNFLSFLTHRIQQISKLMKAICTLLLSRGNQMFHVSFMSARKANKQEDVQQHQRLSFSFHSSAFSIRSVKTKLKASQNKAFQTLSVEMRMRTRCESEQFWQTLNFVVLGRKLRWR